jgi:hypothetical protein
LPSISLGLKRSIAFGTFNTYRCPTTGPTKKPTIRSTPTSVGEQLNLLRRATLLLGYMILQQLFNVGAERTSILLS